MSKALWGFTAVGVYVSALTGLGAAQSQPGRTPKASLAPRAATIAQVSPQPVIDRYCITCHNDRLKTGGLSFEKRDAAHPATDAAVWEKAIRKVNAGMMPPAGAPRPDAATLQGLTASLADALDTAAAAHPNPGPSPLHRLNRNEYANAIRDLLALDIDVEAAAAARRCRRRLRQYRRGARRLARRCSSATWRRR